MNATPHSCQIHTLLSRLFIMIAWTIWLVACGGASPLKQPAALKDVDLSVPMVILPTGHAALELDMAGQTSTYIIDTGAGLQGISQDVAQRLNLPRLPGEIRGAGSGGTFNTYAVTLPAMSIAGYTLHEAWAIVLPLPKGTPFDGVIGADFLKDFVVSMDWEGKRLRLQSNDRFVPPVDAIAVPFELRGRFHQIAIHATLAGRTGWCQIDTGAFNAVTVLRPSVEAFGWRDAFLPRVRTVTGFGAGGTSDGREYGDFVRLPSVQIGPFKMSQVITDLSLAEQGFFSTDAFMCNLGLEIWRRFSLTIDYGSQTLYLRPNAAYAQIFDFQRSGLMLRPEAGRLQVMEVMPKSAADLAGIQRDEWIIAINQRPASEWHSEEIRRLWLSPAGTRVTLAVQGLSTSSPVRTLDISLQDLL